MPGATAERGLGFTGAKAKRPAGTRWGRQGSGWGRQGSAGVSGARWGEAGARWGVRGQVGKAGGGFRGQVEKAGARWVDRGQVGRQGSGGGGSHLNSLEDSGKARDDPWGGTRK